MAKVTIRIALGCNLELGINILLMIYGKRDVERFEMWGQDDVDARYMICRSM